MKEQMKSPAIKDFNPFITFDRETFELYGHKTWIPNRSAIARELKLNRAAMIHYWALKPATHYTLTWSEETDALNNLTDIVAENIRSRRLNGLND